MSGEKVLELSELSFDQLGINENLLRGIYGYGFEKPSIIQDKAIPILMSGKDMIAQAQSGTGKTGCFTVGALQLIDTTSKTIQAIIAIRQLIMTKEISNCLIVVPVSLISNWMYEFKTWGGILKPRVVGGKQNKRKVIYKAILKNGLVLNLKLFIFIMFMVLDK